MRRSSSSSALAAVVLLGLLQGPGTRLTYRVRVVERLPPETAGRVLAGGSVSGPLDTDLRLSLRTESAEIEALFQIAPGVSDTLSLGAEFFTKRRLSRSRRSLPLWEQDTYRRNTRLAWGDTARIHPYGRPRPGTTPTLWVELTLVREFTGGETRPTEEVQVVDSVHELRLEAVVRPRRVRVVLNLVRADTVSAPRGVDLVPAGPPRLMQLVRGGRATTLEVSLARPEPSHSLRHRVLALDADVVCLRVVPADAVRPVGVICGSLNNVARRLALPTGDTLVATFAWPGSR